MRLFLVRHGVTPYNLQARYTGQADIPLSPLGVREAEAVGLRLASEHIDAVVSSDLERARVTAQAIAQHHGLSVLEDPDLRETGLGNWEGLTFAEVRAQQPDLLLHWYLEPGAAPHGGETMFQVRERAERALARWQALYPEGAVVWSTHGGFIGIMLCHLLGLDLTHRRQFRLGNTSITAVDFSRSYPVLLYVNETAHTRGLSADDELDSASTSIR
ncbi:MAG TPA: histidine phosphatase family protein [Ktedonobacteraceae bacterium]|nr:histidine phosphatase family protein [Ktedonobacteraceae bacterium]